MVDSFFVNPAKRAKKRRADGPANPQRSKRPAVSRSEPVDEEITSGSELELSDQPSDEEVSEESDHETEADKRRRLAKEYLQGLETELHDETAFDAKDLDRDIIARRLKQDVAENQGKLFRFLEASSVAKPRNADTKARNLTSVAASWPFAYTAAKDLTIQKWRLSASGKPELVKTIKGGNVKRRSAETNREYLGHFGDIVAIAANSRYVVTGGLDKRIVVWSAENLAPLKVFETRDRQGTVLSLAFRKGSNDLYAGCGDLRLRTYNLDQMAQVEILYGHQDEVVDVAALAQERCVSVGARDRTAIFWKIPEESRLTFRGGDTKLAHSQGTSKEVILEGSIDVCTMLDNQLFVTGSDNGNVSLWSAQKKKPVSIVARAHGTDPALTPRQASAETDPALVEIPPALPRGISALAAIPYSNIVFTGSWSGSVNMWKVSEDQRRLELVREIAVGRGIVTKLSVAEKDAKHNEFVIVATLSREPRLGRWLTKPGKDRIVSFAVSE